MNKKYLIFSILIFIAAFCIRFHYINMKHGFHVDEILSRVLATENVYNSNQLVLNQAGFLSGEEIKNIIFSKPKNSTFTDLKNLRLYNYGEESHPSLYYSLLRIALNSSDNTYQGYINAGCGLNLLLFVFSFFVMRLILIRLFGDNKLVPIGLACAFLNTGTISMTLFIRPYELQILAILIITLVYIEILKRIEENDIRIKDYIIVLLSLTLVFWTGYFLIIYAGMLGLILLWKARKNPKYIISLIGSVILAIGLTYFLNPCYFKFLDGQRFSNIGQTQIITYLYNVAFYISNIINFLFYGLIILLCIICGFFAKNKIGIKGFDIIICAFVWSLFVGIISPFPVVRYIVPAIPLISLLIVNLIMNTDKFKQKIFGILFIIIYLVCGMFPIFKESKDTLITTKNNSLHIPFGGVVENLFLDNMPNLDENIPVIIFSKKWFVPLYIFTDLKNKQKYLIVYRENNICKIPSISIEHYYVFVNIMYDKIIFKDNQNIKIKPIWNFKQYICYEVKKD